MTSTKCWCLRRCLTIALGLLSILAGVYMYLNWIEMFTEMRGKEMALSPTSPSYAGWKDYPLPLNFDVYLFNWTNPQDFYKGSRRKPHFEQLGPYRFREKSDKIDVEWHPHNDSVSYRKKSVFHFDPEASNGTLEDLITSVDTAAHSAALRAKDINSFQKGLFSMLAMGGRGVSVTKTASEWLFEGYSDSLVTFGSIISKFVKEVEVPFDRIGWMYTRNGSSTYDGHFNVFTGADNISKMGQIHAWNHKTHNGAFEGECGDVKGSMGEFFPQNLSPEDSVRMYIPNVCRSIPLDYIETVTVHGVTAYKYSGTVRSVDNGTIFPENKCFCVNNKCEASGIFSISPCKYNSSIYMSYPHFFRADPVYLEAIDGLMPDKEKHEFFMTLEPNAGVPMDVGGGFQANYLMEPIKGIRPFDNIPRTFIPLMWAEERVRVTPEIASDIAIIPTIVLIGQLVTGILFAVGIIMICWYPAKFVTQLCHDPKRKNLLLKPLTTTTTKSISIASPTGRRENVALLERNDGVSLLRASNSATEGLLSNASSNQTSTDTIAGNA